MTSTSNLQQALAILKGTSVIAHDRRAADAFAVDFTKRQFQGMIVLRPSYGISNTMQKALTKLAVKVNFVGGMPSYHFTK